MKPAQQLPLRQCSMSENDLPHAIWMPDLNGLLPDCYQGSALEMAEEMARHMKPGLGVHDAIDLILRSLADEKDIHIDLSLPEGTPESVRAAGFICALLLTGVARKMPQA